MDCTATQHRTEAIRSGALVRAALGQGAQHRLVGDQHQIVVDGQVYSGATLDAVIEAAKVGRAGR